MQEKIIPGKTVKTVKTVAILGAGALGGGIARGLNARDVRVRAVTGSVASAAALQRDGVDARSREQYEDVLAWALTGADVALIGVKPHAVLGLAQELRDSLHPATIVVSLAAGVTLASLSEALPAGQPVCRAMPNTALAVGAGVTGVAASATVESTDIANVKHVFELLGECVVLTEERLAAVTAVSGSGPAYIFYVVEQQLAAAQTLGFTEAEAWRLVHGTLTGACTLLQTGVKPAVLREQVTSPGGTTAKALEVLQNADLAKIFEDAYRANMQRNTELAEAAATTAEFKS